MPNHINNIIRGKTSNRALTNDLNTVLVYIESALKLDEQLHPRCASCGATGNLTLGYAAGNKVSYCQCCKRDEEQR